MSANSGKCKCGSVSVEASRPPFVKFTCHCSHCRGFYDAPCASGGGYWGPALTVKGRDQLECTNTFVMGGLAGLQRQRCKKCKQPVIAEGIRGYMGLAFIPLNVLNAGKPEVNVYTNGCEPSDKTLKTISSDLGSMTYFVGKMITSGGPQLPGLLMDCFKGKPKAQ